MPVATFPGERGWGYDGVLTFAPHRAYGGPHGLARLVDAAHAAGLARDPRRRLQPHRPRHRAASRAFGPYFTDRHDTFWGDAIDYSPARRARVGDPERRAVGARLPHRRAAPRRRPRDLRRERRRTSCAELAERVRAAHPGALVISEMEVGEPAADRGVGPRRAVGGRAPPRAARPADGRAGRATTRPTVRSPTLRAAYEDDAAGAARRSARRTTTRSATARSATGCRRTRAASPPPCTLFAPQTPLLFMGEEHGETRAVPVLHRPRRPGIAEATREGRRKEFARFAVVRAARTSPTRRRSRRSSARSSDPRRRPRPARVLPRADRAAPHAAARGRDRRGRGAPRAARAPRRRRARRRLRAA